MISKVKEIVGENFYHYRKEAKLSQFELAELADSTQRIVSKIENCTENYSIETLEKFSNALKVKIHRLFIPHNPIDSQKLILDSVSSYEFVMLLYIYYLTKKKFKNEEIAYDSYGIALKDFEEISIEDISSDKGFVESLCEICNDFQVSPTHFFEVIQDALEKHYGE